MSDNHCSLIDRIAKFVEVPPKSGVRLVGVDGPSGSGKNTLAGPLADRLDAPLVEIDDFVSWSDFAGWWPRFETQVLEPLIEGRDAVYQQRDWKNDEFGMELGSWRTVPWSRVVVIEGVTATRRAIANRLACSVWVEAPGQLRLERGLARDGESHRGFWEQWMIAEQAFYEVDRPADRADFVVSGLSDESS